MPVDAGIYANGVILPGPNALPSSNFQAPAWNSDGTYAGAGITQSFSARSITTGGDPPTVSATGPQIDLRGTIDASSANVFGVWMDWATAGSAANNLNGLRVRLTSGYTGGGICRAVAIDNLVAGSMPFQGYDQAGNMGLSSACQGNAPLGDNIGLHGIASGAQLNIGVFGRAARTSAANDAWCIANVGGMFISTNFASGIGSQVAGYFQVGAPAVDWRTEVTGVNAVILAGTGVTPIPLFIGRINSADRFTITSKAGINQVLNDSEIGYKLKLHSSQATDALQILDSDDVVLTRITSAGNLTVTNSAAAAILTVASAGNSVGSGNVRFDLTNGDAVAWAFQNAGSGNLLLRIQHGGATKATWGSDGSLALGFNGTPPTQLYAASTALPQGRFAYDVNNYLTVQVSSAGVTTITGTSSGTAAIIFSSNVGIGGAPSELFHVNGGRGLITHDSSLAFRVSTAGGTAILTVNTATPRVTVGSSVAIPAGSWVGVDIENAMVFDASNNTVLNAITGVYINLDANAGGASGDFVIARDRSVVTGGTELLRVTEADGNLGLGITTFGTSAAKVFSISNGTAPGSSVADSFQQYSADQTAGNACPHFRSEAGHIIKLFSATHINDPSGGGTQDAEARTAIGSILDLLEANGLMAA